MTEQKYVEDPQEEKEQPEKVDFPSEDNLAEWQAEKMARESQNERQELPETDATSAERDEPKPLPKKVEKNAADFLIQNTGEREEQQYSQAEKADNQKSWQRFIEPSQRQRAYHHFPHYFYAGFWIRAFAFLVDILCISLISSILLNGILSFVGLKAGGNLTPYGLLSLAIYLGYFVLMTKFTNGQTLGKMIFGIQVVCFKEENLSWATVLVREGACRFILKSGLGLIGYLPAAFTPTKQHLGDFLSDTSVVTLNSIKAYNGVKF